MYSERERGNPYKPAWILSMLLFPFVIDLLDWGYNVSTAHGDIAKIFHWLPSLS